MTQRKPDMSSPLQKQELRHISQSHHKTRTVTAQSPKATGNVVHRQIGGGSGSISYNVDHKNLLDDLGSNQITLDNVD